MDYRPRIEARRGVDAGAGLNNGLRMDVGARFDGRRVAAGIVDAGGLICGADGLADGAHELEIQLGGDQIDGGRESHAGL